MKKDLATQISGMQGVIDLFIENEEKGIAKIENFHYSEARNPFYNINVVRNSGHIFRMYEGDYIKLYVNNELMMSDTTMERISNQEFIKNAKGRVLVAGLGLGLILRPILCNTDVTEIIVIEKYPDVISLVEPKYQNPKLKIIEADIFDYDMPKDEKFDCIYFDIWPKISIDNLLEIRKLHYKYRKNKRTKESYMESWMRKYLMNKRRSSNY